MTAMYVSVRGVWRARVCVRLHNSHAVFAFLRLFSLFLLLIK